MSFTAMTDATDLLRRARARAVAHIDRARAMGRSRLHPHAAREADRRDDALPPGYHPITVVTWNIHSCVGLDARFAPDRVAAVLRYAAPDIVGLQEVGWHHRGEAGIDQFDYLATSTGMTALAAPTKHHARAHYGNAVLTRLPVLETRPLDLAVPMREPRGGICAILDAGGSPLRVMVAHLGLDPWERRIQVDRLLAEVDRAPDLPTLIMGDLNEWRPRAPRLKRLAERLPEYAAPRSFPAQLPTLRLDRIYASGDLKLAGFQAMRTAVTRRASDHLPVRALIGVPQRA